MFGLERGFCLMIGGEDEPVERLGPDLQVDRARAGHGRADAGPDPDRHRPGRVPALRASGAGHFVKMVHNGIEYGMMAAIAEGLSIIKHANVGKAGMQVADAETTPLRDPESYQYDIDVGEVAEVWRRGSVISSWLIDLTADALARSPQLDDFAGRVSDSGEGRWTVMAAIEEGVPAAVITAALFERFESRGLGEFSRQAAVRACAASSAGTRRSRPTNRRAAGPSASRSG